MKVISQKEGYSIAVQLRLVVSMCTPDGIELGYAFANGISVDAPIDLKIKPNLLGEVCAIALTEDGRTFLEMCPIE